MPDRRGLLQQIQEQASKRRGIWYQAEGHDGVLFYWKRLRDPDGATECLGVASTDVDIGRAYLEALSADLEGWIVVRTEPLRGRSGVKMFLRKVGSCQRCGREVDASAKLYGSGDHCSPCEAVLKVARTKRMVPAAGEVF